MNKPKRRDYPSTVAGLQAYNKAKSNWNKKQKSDRQTAIAGKPLRRNFPSTVQGLKNYNAAKSNWVKKKNKNLKDLKNKTKPDVKEKLKINKVDPKQFDNRKPKVKPSENTGNGGSGNNGKPFENRVTGNGKSKTPKYKKVTQAELDAKITERKKAKEKLKIGYRRTKGEGIEKKGGGYRGDTRITKKLKKSGFTETRLAKLRKKNAEFQAAKKDKKKMKAYRAKYG